MPATLSQPLRPRGTAGLLGLRLVLVGTRGTTQLAFAAADPSSSLPGGGTFSFHFTTAGTFSYHRTIHPGMRAVIFVPSAPGQQPSANDGRQLSNESAATQMLLSAVWRDQAALEWVRERRCVGGSPDRGRIAGRSAATTGAPAPAAPAPAPAAPAPAPAAPAPTYP